jgi:hypothetical protein
VRPIAVSRPPRGSKYGSAFGSASRSTMCAATKSAMKKAAYDRDAVETTSWRAM